MKKILLTLALLCSIAVGEACTSAIVSGKLTSNGRPLLWKNRDTNDQNNRVERIAAHDGLLEFVALFDARDLRDTAAWMGFNERGFAIMNTASYNLNKDNVKEKDMDKEGVVMRYALERCTTVDDFERVLQTLPKPLGVEANFGVIDAQGNGAYFEAGNYSYVKYDLKDEPSGILTRTNYSFSGRDGEGYGYIRHENEKYLLRDHIAAADITPAVFTEGLSRTFYHSQLGRDYTHSGYKWVVDQDFIARRISTASVVIEGVTSTDAANYISARNGEIMANINNQLTLAGLSTNDIRSIVLVGGGSQLQGLVAKLQETMAVNVTVGSYPSTLNLLDHSINRIENIEILSLIAKATEMIEPGETCVEIQTYDDGLIVQPNNEAADKKPADDEDDDKRGRKGKKKEKKQSGWAAKIGSALKNLMSEDEEEYDE